MNLFYNLGISLYSAAVGIAATRNNKARLMKAGQAQTFGILAEKVDTSASYIWIHVSSLGEFEQGRPLMEMIKKHTPEKKILLTFFSPSGYEVRKDYPLADVVCYLPMDKPSLVRRFLDAVKIEKAFFVKYEFWGNYLSELKRRASRHISFQPFSVPPRRSSNGMERHSAACLAATTCFLCRTRSRARCSPG